MKEIIRLACKYRKILSPDMLVQAAGMSGERIGHDPSTDRAEDQQYRTMQGQLLEELNHRLKKYEANNPPR